MLRKTRPRRVGAASWVHLVFLSCVISACALPHHALLQHDQSHEKSLFPAGSKIKGFVRQQAAGAVTVRMRQSPRRIQSVVSVSRPGEEDGSVVTVAPSTVLPVTTVAPSSSVPVPVPVPATLAPSVSVTTMVPATATDATDAAATTNVPSPATTTTTTTTNSSTAGGVGGVELMIVINFLVSSTTENALTAADLQPVINVFVEKLMSDWSTSRMRRILLTTNTNTLRGSFYEMSLEQEPIQSTNNNNNNMIRPKRNRRLQVTLVPNTAIIQEPLTPSTDCVVSVSQENSNCYNALGQFEVRATSEESPDTVCTDMRRSIGELTTTDLDDIVQQATNNTNLELQSPAMKVCTPLANYEAPTSTAPVVTVAPSSSAPTLASANVFNHSENVTAPAAAPITRVPTTRIPTTLAPSGQEYEDAWLSLLNDVKEEEGDGEVEDDKDEEGGDGEEDATDDDDNNSTETDEPKPVSNATRDYWLERQEFDDKLDEAMFIIAMILGGLFVCVCCFYWADAAWIIYRWETVIASDQAYYHDGRYYYDEQCKFPRPWDEELPENAGPLGGIIESDESSGAQFDLFNKSGSMGLSNSEDFEDYDDDGWDDAEEEDDDDDDYDPDENGEESGEMYGAGDEQEDVFDEDDEDPESYREPMEEKQDCFDDEAEAQRLQPSTTKPTKRKKKG